MAIPVVELYDGSDALMNLASYLLDYGNVDAGDSSLAKTVTIWNNRGTSGNYNAEGVDKMFNCVLTTRDDSFGLNGHAIITDKWVKVKNVSGGDTDFTAVGSNYDGVSTYTSAEKSIKAGGAAAAGEILGTANDGLIAGTGIVNAAEVQIKVDLPSGIGSEEILYKTRLRYSY